MTNQSSSLPWLCIPYHLGSALLVHLRHKIRSCVVWVLIFINSKSFLIVWLQVVGGRPRPLFPSTISITFLVMWFSFLLITWPYYLMRFSLSFSSIFVTLNVPRIYSFLIRSILVTPPAHRSILISVVCSFCSSTFLIGQHSEPYKSAGLMACLYTLPLVFLAFGGHRGHLSWNAIWARL